MSKLVLDVSRWDEGIDLAAWHRKHALWGVIVKCGGNEGGRYMDRCFAAHYANAKATGLHIGAYYYSTATDTATAKADAQHCVSLLRGRDFDLPIYIDVEDAGQTTIGKRRLTDVILTFIREVESAGYIGGVYTSGSWWANNVNADELRPYANWIAWWTASKPAAIADVGMWQFGSMRLSDGDIQHDDVSGYVDANLCYVDYPARGKTDGGDTVGKVLVRINDKAATIHHAMCKDERNGYSQYPNRWGGDYGSKPTTAKVSTKWWTVEYLLGSYDCSSSTILAWRLALVGTKYEGVLDDATCTSDMLDVFLASGLFTASLTPAKRGDLYLTPGKHVAMCQDGGSDGVFNADVLSEFNRNENHGAYNGKPGDQDGLESVVKAYYNFPWATVLHYNGKADYYVEDGEKAPAKPSKVKPTTRGVYRVYDAANARHHWTSDAAEAQKLVDAGWTYEGVAWKSTASGSKVYRAYNPKTGDHLLCVDAARMLDAIGKGWRYEGVSFCAGGDTPVYELYDSGHKEHFYTADASERNTCKGWMSDKGVAFRV